MRASLQAFITREARRRDRVNFIWKNLRGKAAILADYVNATDGTRMVADPDIILTGAGIASDTSASAVEGGKFYAVTSDATNDVVLGPATLANGSPLTEFKWSTDQEVETEWLIQIDATLTDRWTKCGLMLTDTVDDPSGAQDTDDDQIAFSMNENASIDLNTSIGTTNDKNSALYVAAASDYVHLAIKIDARGQARAFINRREVQMDTGYFGGTISAGNVVDLVPFYAVEEDTSAGSHPKINLLQFAISRAIGPVV